jgi:hypothetical protein
MISGTTAHSGPEGPAKSGRLVTQDATLRNRRYTLSRQHEMVLT